MNETNSTARGREPSPSPPSWPERNVKLIVRGTVALGVGAVIFDLVFGFIGHKHIHFAVEGVPGFYALTGFLSYLGLVLTAKALRKILARSPGYLDEGPPLLALRDGLVEEDSDHQHHARDDAHSSDEAHGEGGEP